MNPRQTCAVTELLKKDPGVRGIEIDSRRVRPGDLFVALPCAEAGQHAREALAKGAAGVVAEEGSAGAEIAQLAQGALRGAAVYPVASAHEALIALCQAFYQPRPQTLLAVTGTNGKTSTVTLARQLLAALGVPAASVGTLGVQTSAPDGSQGALPAPDMTTYDTPILYSLLQQLASQGTQAACLEATSHGLAQGRLEGLAFQAGALTNITQDHLDYHGTMGAYAVAKRRLFEERVVEGGVAILNRSSAFLEAFEEACHRRRLTHLLYGLKEGSGAPEGCALGISHIIPERTRTVFDLHLLGETFTGVALNLIGRFQLENLLAALGLVLGSNLSADRTALVEAIAGLKAIPGRMEAVPTPQGATVFIDFCHTPDALSQALGELRRLKPRRLTVLFGCGGERDRAKRPLMGRLASEKADHVIVTEDNPRSEAPEAIRAAILEGALEGPAKRVEEIPGRKEAIHQALKELEAGEVLLIAGRGHEAFQKIGAARIPFRDREVVEAILAEM